MKTATRTADLPALIARLCDERAHGFATLVELADAINAAGWIGQGGYCWADIVADLKSLRRAGLVRLSACGIKPRIGTREAAYLIPGEEETYGAVMPA